MRAMDRRLWAKIERDGDCWIWTGGKTSKGYGFLRRQTRPWLAHRYVWTLFHGPIPAGLDLDHVRDRGCRHRHCVRPAHLEPVSCRTNLMRGDTLAAENAAKVACPEGHPYSGDNVRVTPEGRRVCRTCHRNHARRYRAERKASRAA